MTLLTNVQLYVQEHGERGAVKLEGVEDVLGGSLSPAANLSCAEAGVGGGALGEGTESHCFVKRNIGTKCCRQRECLLASSREYIALNVAGGEGHHTSAPGEVPAPGEGNTRARASAPPWTGPF